MVKTTVMKVPEKHWMTQGVAGEWTLQDIVMHLAEFEHVLVDIFNTLLDSSIPTPALDAFTKPETFNDDVADKSRASSPRAVWHDYEDTQAEAASLLAQIPVAKRRQAGLLPWYGAEYDLEDFIVYTIYGHKREHCAQIDEFRSRLQQDD